MTASFTWKAQVVACSPESHAARLARKPATLNLIGTDRGDVLMGPCPACRSVIRLSIADALAYSRPIGIVRAVIDVEGV